MAAYALEIGGKAEVTIVLRSNYPVVRKNGFDIDSIEHGRGIKSWRPTSIRNSVPNVVKEESNPFDFVLVTTKNIPDVSPTVEEIIATTITPGRTAIVLSQNGLNIEKPIISRFPTNPVISSISYIGATEKVRGKISQDNLDVQKIGPFDSLQVAKQTAEDVAKRYVHLYNPEGKLGVVFDAEVNRTRWRKLLYNASYNSVAAVLRMDTPRMRMSQHVVDDLVRPIMKEILAAARACGVQDLSDELIETVVHNDPTDREFKPSMCQDLEKGNLMEIENIVGEPLREGEAHGVSMPTLKVMYGLLRGLQLQVKETRGLWVPRFEQDNPYR
ncbi:putative 2-dehydropantoate 2-reductase [Seiridium unicorne]|uniref:2-dehydropantoate 2-reductase n=1 Tax=Seiridium unicorne TaxID=138068 RepID=A0ABR2UVA8_9PEZI